MTKKKLVFVEFGTAHEDCFYSHFKVLERDYNLHIILNEKLSHLLPKTISYASVTSVKVKDRASISVAWEVRKKIKAISPEQVIFNTAQGNVVRDLCLLMPRGIRLAGTHHNADKLLTSSSQKLINWHLKKYLLLGNFIQKTLQDKIHSELKFEVFYPCYYEKIPVTPLPKTKDLLVAIPGVIEQSRRDYFGFLDIIKRATLPHGVHFVLLGNGSREDGPRFYQEIQKAGLEDRFTFFNQYVSAEEMQRQLEACDVILPILHPGVEYFDLYKEYKISGSYNLAYGYVKPLLMHEELGRTEEFKDYCLSYSIEGLPGLLGEIHNNPQLLDKPKENIKKSPRFDFEKQRERYLTFIKE